MSKNTLPVIAGVQIAVDSDNRYNINALHQASGGDKRHQPSNWLRSEQTQEIIADIEAEEGKQAVFTVQGGVDQGTFVHKELAYTYAMWISPKFHRQVVKTFDAVLAGDFTKALSEAQKAKIAFYEDAKKRKTIPSDLCDLQIAFFSDNKPELERLRQKQREADERRESSMEYYVEQKLKDVHSGGYEFTLQIPEPFDVAKTIEEIQRVMNSRDAICRFTPLRADGRLQNVETM